MKRRLKDKFSSMMGKRKAARVRVEDDDEQTGWADEVRGRMIRNHFFGVWGVREREKKIRERECVCEFIYIYIYAAGTMMMVIINKGQIGYMDTHTLSLSLKWFLYYFIFLHNQRPALKGILTCSHSPSTYVLFCCLNSSSLLGFLLPLPTLLDGSLPLSTLNQNSYDDLI